MKKAVIFFVALTMSMVAFGQNDTTLVQVAEPAADETKPLSFVCEAFDNDIATFREICGKYNNYKLKKWAQELNSHFTTDDTGAIHLEYVLMANHSYDIEQVKTYAIGWFNQAFSGANAIKAMTDNSISATGTLVGIAQKSVNAIYYAKSITVSADIDVILRFKENRIKIDTYIRHYKYISGDSMMKSKNTLITCGDVFPVVNDKTDDQVYACAFINSLDNSFGKIDSFIKYMNRPAVNVQNEEEDW